MNYLEYLLILDCGTPRTLDNATLNINISIEVYVEESVISLPQLISYNCSAGYGLVESSHKAGVCVGGNPSVNWSSQFLFGLEMLEDYPQCVLGIIK